MNLEQLITGLSERSTSLHDSFGKGGGGVSSITFRDIIKSSVAMLDSKFDQEFVLFVYIDQGDKEFIHRQLLNMIYSEVPDMEGLVAKVDRLKRTSNYPAFFKGTRALDDMLRECAYLAVDSAVQKRRFSSRDAASRIGCSKDTYITHYRDAVMTIAQNLSDRLVNAERKIRAVVYD